MHSVCLRVLSLCLLFFPNLVNAETSANRWLEVQIGIISSASEDILQSAIHQVESEKRAGLLLTLDTPGGSLESTRTMVKAIMAVNFPVVVWVGPDGSRAGSAGSFITISGHIAAMAPG
jgi:membrane-bound serine protease (ClpP class)